MSQKAEIDDIIVSDEKDEPKESEPEQIIEDSKEFSLRATQPALHFEPLHKI